MWELFQLEGECRKERRITVEWTNKTYWKGKLGEGGKNIGTNVIKEERGEKYNTKEGLRS
jgi:hypothetical protein